MSNDVEKKVIFAEMKVICFCCAFWESLITWLNDVSAHENVVYAGVEYGLLDDFVDSCFYGLSGGLFCDIGH